MERNFTNCTEYAASLQERGFKIKKSTVYAAKKKGWLKMQADGSISHADAVEFEKRLTLKYRNSLLRSDVLVTVKAELNRKIDRLIFFRSLIEEYGALRVQANYSRKRNGCGCNDEAGAGCKCQSPAILPGDNAPSS